jgi:hypothetical protein
MTVNPASRYPGAHKPTARIYTGGSETAHPGGLLPAAALDRFSVGHHLVEHKIDRAESSHWADDLQSRHDASNP